MRKKSTGGLAKLLEKLRSQDLLDLLDDCSDLSEGVFDGDSDDVIKLKAELQKCKEDLLNDEKIFAEQQIDFEQVKNEMNDKISQYQEEVHKLNLQMEKLGDCEVSDCQNTTLKKSGIKMTRTKPCTMEDIEEIMRKKTFVIMERNIKNCMGKASGKAKSKQLLETFTKPSKCPVKDHNNLEGKISELSKANEKLLSEIKQMKNTNANIHETKKTLEKSISSVRKQKSDLENRFLMHFYIEIKNKYFNYIIRIVYLYFYTLFL